MTQNSYFLEESVKTAVLAKMTQNGSNSGNMAKTGPKQGQNRPFTGIWAKYMLFWACFGHIPRRMGQIRGIWPISRDMGWNTGYLAYIPGYGPNTWVLGLF